MKEANLEMLDVKELPIPRDELTSDGYTEIAEMMRVFATPDGTLRFVLASWMEPEHATVLLRNALALLRSNEDRRSGD
jgi:hypothetical protein